ncbi:hypothetical protein CEUSTIGMA_g12880.t1 [Chlamydomonas eustigma]|uniref:Secondary thiamine-phosphate synthase enzyme n=1 Tax=Chlamydomonas eustigma TaxID=1157962 RepID=A0A250XQX7_9CHLO|nr:hypothetical protein CEUSTIGMA_g12880.t1 [Chlamydomonas eustigma]|eukprot:GAX85464.1 hypothetical protein CEUSTIGMA_g12880.t1 [Chlamydomonas eustigma]
MSAVMNKAVKSQLRPFGARKQANVRLQLRLRGSLSCLRSSVERRTDCKFFQIGKETGPGISITDITPEIKHEIEVLNIREGTVHVLSQHTTTAVTINESEPRLMNDIKQWLLKLAPPGEPYLHNDLHLREAPKGWPGGHAAWVAQEPINAHSHLLSILIGNTLSVPVSDGKLCLGTWQSILLVDLDGPRKRTVGVQLVRHGSVSV